jgi:hypothetical protein
MELTQRPEFEEAVTILIRVEDNKIKITPFGGSFKDNPFDAEEVYGIMQAMLDAYNSYASERIDVMTEMKHLPKRMIQ